MADSSIRMSFAVVVSFENLNTISSEVEIQCSGGTE